MMDTAEPRPSPIHRLLEISKLRAFSLHLLVSALVVGTVCGLIFFFWYPAPYFAAQGAAGILGVLVGVDLVLGPTLTLILYRPRKPRLIFDLAVIAVIQLTALIYGTTVIYQERPYYSVFAVDRFEVLARKDVDASTIDTEALRYKPWRGPILAVARLPEDPQRFQTLLEEIIFEGKPDIERRPEFWSPYANASGDVIARGRSLAELVQRKPDSASRVSDLVASLDREVDTLLYLPLVGKNSSFAFVVDAETGMPLDIINVDPWDAS